MSVIIVGGGMTGATLALAISALSNGKLPVTLVEAKRPIQTHPGFDARAIALAYGTCQRLQQIGLWQALSDCVTPITHVHVSDKGHAGFVNLDADDYHIPALGNVIELHDAGQRLFALLDAAPNIKLYCPDSVESIERSADKVDVILTSGEKLSAQVLVAADGSRSKIAQACGCQWQSEEYDQVAVIANVLTTENPNGRAFERFTSQGPLAFLPMSQGRSSLVWCHSRENSQTVQQWDDAQFIQQLQTTFGWRLGKIKSVGERHCYPLALVQSQSQIAHRVALVGNASQTLHPIAGQGFNLGMRDVMALASVLCDAYSAGRDLGSYAELMRYQSLREQDRKNTVNLTDSLVKLFTAPCLPIIAGRNLGLMAMELLPMCKDRLARQTLGWVKNS